MKKTHMSDNKNKEVFEFTDLIQKEKEEALQSFQKKDFESKLNEQIEAEQQQPAHEIFWLRKPVISVSLVLIVVIIGWVTAQLLTTPSNETDAEIIEQALTLATNSYGFMKEQSVPIEPQSALANLYEIEWYAKSVVYSNRRENIPDEDIPQIFSQVLQNSALIKKEEEDEPEDLKLKRRTQSLKRESNVYPRLSQI